MRDPTGDGERSCSPSHSWWFVPPPPHTSPPSRLCSIQRLRLRPPPFLYLALKPPSPPPCAPPPPPFTLRFLASSCCSRFRQARSEGSSSSTAAIPLPLVPPPLVPPSGWPGPCCCDPNDEGTHEGMCTRTSSDRHSTKGGTVPRGWRCEPAASSTLSSPLDATARARSRG